MTLLGFVWRDLLRNPRRTLASLVGVVVGVGLFSAVLFFIDGSGASMTKRAVAPLTLDAQRVLTSPLGGGLRLDRTVTDRSLAPGATARVTLTVTNGGLAPAHEVVVRDSPSAPLTYLAGSTTLDDKSVPDVGGIPLSQGSAGIGLNIGTVPPGAARHLSYTVNSSQPVPDTAAIPVQSTVTTREALDPQPANAPRPVPLTSLAASIRALPGISAADALVLVDLQPGALSAKGVSVPGGVKLFAFDQSYARHYRSIALLSGAPTRDGVAISAEAARALHIGIGDQVSLTLPSPAKPLTLPVSGITDLTRARPLFESREPAHLERFRYVPFTVVVSFEVYSAQIVPAYEAAVAQRSTRVTSLPLEELDLLLDRRNLNSDPATAVAQTQQVAQVVRAVAPGQDYLIDNISNTLLVARGDAKIAKRMFIFLGLPGAILAAILTAYAGTLLAGAQRRETALLRVRGANRRHLLRLLALRTVALAGVGALLGTALGFMTVLSLLGSTVLFEASTGALVQSTLIGILGGMTVTAFALYEPGRRLIAQEIKQDLTVTPRPAATGRRRLQLELLALLAAVAGQLYSLQQGAFDVLTGSVYDGRSVTLPLQLLIAPIVAWLAGTLLLAHGLQFLTARTVARRSVTPFRGLVPGVLWRSMTRRLGPLAGGTITVALVVALGTMLACFSTVYDQAKTTDARFRVGSDIRLTPNPTSGAPHPTSLFGQFAIAGSSATPVVYSPQNAVLASASNDDVATLAAIDPASYPAVGALQDSIFTGATAQQSLNVLRAHPDGVLVNSVLAHGLKLHVGDQAHVLLGRGTDQQTRKDMTVLGLFTQFPGSPQGTDLVANLSYYQQQTHLMQADYFLVAPDDRSSAGLARTVGALSAQPGFTRSFTVQTSAASLDKNQSSLTALNVVGLLQINSLFTFLMAATATAMFVFGLLMARRKEYVTLRAQGLGSREVRQLVLAESGVSALLGSVIGLSIGVLMASQFVQVLRPIFTLAPPLRLPLPELSILGVLVLAATALSALAAAVLIGRLKPTELLRDE